MKNASILILDDSVSAVDTKTEKIILENLDRDLVKGALAGEKFKDLFFANCQDEKIADCVKKIIG
jgi:fructose-1,6-bisphosphatase/inositol monophosphatase family enzyme